MKTSFNGLLTYKLPDSNIVAQCELVQQPQDLTQGHRAFVQPFVLEENKPRLSHDAQEHSALVKKAIAAMNHGSLQKVVASRIIQVPFLRPVGEHSKRSVFDWLAGHHPKAFVYHLEHPSFGTWTGASPEVLLHQQGHQFRTMALAGTRQENSQSLPWGDKEKQEQLFVTQYILNLLEPYTAEVSTSDPYTMKAGNIEHIRTDIRFVSHSPIFQLLNALHPTPAVAGTPLKEAMQFIIAEEKHARELYSGYTIVHLPDDAYVAFVNLRCMQWTNDAALIYVGGGITADSDPEAEWKETNLKSRTIMEALENAQLV